MEDAFAARAGCVGGSARQRGQPAEKQSYRRIKFLRCESQDPASQQDVRGGRSIRTRATNEPRIAHVQCGCSVQRTAYVQGRDRTGTAIVSCFVAPGLRPHAAASLSRLLPATGLTGWDRAFICHSAYAVHTVCSEMVYSQPPRAKRWCVVWCVGPLQKLRGCAPKILFRNSMTMLLSYCVTQKLP